MAIFDIDGTIFRSSLLIELTDALIQEGILKPRIRKIYEKSYEDWLNRRDVYEKYINNVVVAFQENLKGVKAKVFLRVAQKTVAFHKDRVYRYAKKLVNVLKKKNYYLLAISNSPKMILDEFCGNLRFNKVYGRIYEIDDSGRFTGKTLYEDVISDKAKVLERAVEKEYLTLKGSIGVGDTESDISFLKKVDKPICFNPNRNLLAYARRTGWKVVVERKDVVYFL